MILRKTTLSVIAAVALLVAPAAARADFGIAPGSLSALALNGNGTLDELAGSHPFSYTVNFNFNTVASGEAQGGAPRDIIASLPPGFVGNPLAVPRCTRQQYEGILPKCPTDTQVGTVRAILPGTGSTRLPLFNLVPPPGIAAQLGAGGVNLNVLGDASVRPEEGYRVSVGVFNIPVEVTEVTETIWGVPADSRHDSERGGEALDGGAPVKSTAPFLPFLTMPTSCAGPLDIDISADSILNPGTYVTESALSLNAGGDPAPLVGCESVPFSPGISSQPTTGAGETSSGLGFQLALPNQGLLGPGAVAETEPVKSEVTLPRGITANPAAATGLVGCSEAQYRGATSEPGTGCPGASKLGTLIAKTPLLEEPIEGSVYLATPHQNPFGTLIALYIVARAPERGVLVKQAGKVESDPSTGQLTTTFDELPPLPYSSFELNLREGPRGPLITPQACGEYRTIAKLYPYSKPGTADELTAPFKITSGSGGSGCVTSESAMPNSPSLQAGSTISSAGSYSPFVFQLSREDGSQRFSAVVAEPPLGLTARLAGIPYCPESGIAQAVSRTAEGDGAVEQAQPSCPAASQVGTVTAGAGAGSSPYSTNGKIYLAGPYEGAPLSFVVIAPAVAGPFDLGVVTSRIAAFINQESAKIVVKSDPLPRILHGVPLDLRSISVQMDKPEFTLNPTNCEATTVDGSLTSQVGAVASLSQRFQVGGCKALDFKPGLKVQLEGGTKRTGHPALKAVVTYPKGGEYANVARAQVALPHALFLDQGNLNKTCTRPVLLAGNCPASTVYGHAKAWTPLFEKPLEGNVYLVGGYGYKLPAIVAELNGQVRILLKGKVDTAKSHGIRTTFEAVPDAPVSRFVLEMKGGRKYGLLEISENLCRSRQRANALFGAQNGKSLELHPIIKNGCSKKKQGGRTHGKR